MTKPVPLVSIGMPVYNGEKYIEDALESLLAQDHPNIELVISNNASTDRTAAICQEYAERYSHIKLISQPRNIGASGNFRAVVDAATGEYFMWAAHDDLWSPNYVSACVAVLQRHQRYALCASTVHFIDESGSIVNRTFENLDTTSRSTPESCAHILEQDFWCAIYGVMRIESARRAPIERPSFGMDVAALIHICMMGKLACQTDCTFYYRLFSNKTPESMMEVFDPYRATKIVYPWSEIAIESLSAAIRSNLSWLERIQCCYAILRSIIKSDSLIATQIHSEQLQRLFQSRELSSPTSAMATMAVLCFREPKLVFNKGAWSILGRSFRIRRSVGRMS